MSTIKNIDVHSVIKADAYIRRWSIVDDDIYLLRFKEAPPQWLEDLMLSIIDDTGVVDDLDNLTGRFDNLETGYYNTLYDWVDGDKQTMLQIETMYVSNQIYNAGIQEIKTTYVSKTESGAFFDSLIGAWQTGSGGAWFNEKVQVVSNVAYAAAKSASTLTATMKSQRQELDVIIGDIETLEKQVDGKVETHTGSHPVITPQGVLIETAEPYVTWVANGTLPEHTGDTYLQVEITANGQDRLLGVYRFGKDITTDKYNWHILTDDLAAKAYQEALDAGVLADGKINTYYQPLPPTYTQDNTLGEGDIWLDSDDHNKMYRYDGSDPYSDTGWRYVRDTDITASVNRLDQATVDINGVATAKSSLQVNADGNISGFVASASNDPDFKGSEFRIFADRFTLAATAGQTAGHPFTVDTITNDIKFNGRVEFSNIDGGNDIVLRQTLQTYIDSDVTVISGGKIQTGTIDANLVNVTNLNASNITAGVIYNTGGSAANYTMAISLDAGFIHIK